MYQNPCNFKAPANWPANCLPAARSWTCLTDRPSRSATVVMSHISATVGVEGPVEATRSNRDIISDVERAYYRRCTDNAVRRHLEEAGKTQRRQGSSLDQGSIDAIVDLHKVGHTTTQIAHQLGCTPSRSTCTSTRVASPPRMPCARYAQARRRRSLRR